MKEIDKLQASRPAPYEKKEREKLRGLLKKYKYSVKRCSKERRVEGNLK
jgi:hypothetical protein